MGDNITRPDHYCEGREYEPKDVIRDWGLNFNLGSAVKYISRAGRKGDKLEDLKKAKQFLEFEIEASSEENDLKCIVRKIDNDELDCFDISNDLYCGYQDIRDAIERQALRHATKEHKDNIGMTSKEAAEIGDAIAKGLEAGIKEAKEKYDEAEENLDAIERKISWYANGITSDVLNGKMKFEDVPNVLKPLVFKGIADEVLNGMVDISSDILSDELREKIIDYAIEKLEDGDLSPFDLPTYIMDHPRVADWGRSLQKILNRIHIEDSVEITFKFEKED